MEEASLAGLGNPLGSEGYREGKKQLFLWVDKATVVLSRDVLEGLNVYR